MLAQVTLQQTPWTICPSSGFEEIIQNVRCILLTAKGSCFMYRDFGTDTELIDKPLNVAKNRFLAEVVKQVAKYESRARVKSIRWTGDGPDGILKPTVILEVQT